MTMEIETGFAVPTESSGRARYPFQQMDIGNSILAPREVRQQVWTAARMFKHRNPGWNCTAQQQPDGSVRIWRIA